jgi:polysaccharide biosynthesis protein PslG
MALIAACAAPAGAIPVRPQDIAGVASHPWRLGPDTTPLPFWPLRDPRKREAIFSSVEGMGVHTMRVDLRWYMVEPWIKGVRDWTEFDAIHQSAQAHHVTLLPVVAMPPAWANGGGGAWTYPKNPKDFEDFMTAAMERYPDIPAWEIWNEPNLLGFSQPEVDPAKFVAMLKAAHEAKLRSGANTAVISGGLLAPLVGSNSFFEAMVRLHAFDYVDGFGIHPYSPQAPLTSGSSFLKLPWFHDRLVDIGKPNMGIWITEYGASTSAVATEYGPPMGGSEQAERLRDGFALATRWPWVKNLTWYEFQDLCTDPLDVMCNFGLVHEDMSPKPSSAAMKDVVHGDVPKLRSRISLDREPVPAGTRRSKRRAVSFGGKLFQLGAEDPAGVVKLALAWSPDANGRTRLRRVIGTAAADGRFYVTVSNMRAGWWRAVATYPGTSDYDSDRSEPVKVRVTAPRHRRR